MIEILYKAICSKCPIDYLIIKDYNNISSLNITFKSTGGASKNQIDAAQKVINEFTYS